MTDLDLTTRTEAGAALTLAQHDANLTAIQTKVNAIIAKLALLAGDDGTLVAGVIDTVAALADNLITLAKMSALDEADYGKFIRANASTGALEAAVIATDDVETATEVNSTGAQAGLSLGSFVFSDVPAGDILVFGVCHGKRNAGANGGTVWLEEATAGDIAHTNTHVVDDGTTGWKQFTLIGRIADFAGGTLTLAMKFETDEGTSDITFGVAGDGRFGRRVTILGGL